jgi:DeoR/GlpR family transcriptional regulator of sugar metabolism
VAQELAIEDRRARELEILSKQGFVSLTELAQLVDVSDSTVRRDLELLEEQGVIRRTHGGAVYVKDSASHRLAFADRQMRAALEKQAIARAVADLVPAGQTVILNGGTTCFQVARAISGRRVSVITNSVPIATLLSTDLATEVTLIGGYVYPRTGVALGATALQQLGLLHAGQLIMSCAGVTREGTFNANQMMVEVERKMMMIADQVILAADHTKFGMRGVTKLCELDELDVIVTDAGVDEAAREWLLKLNAKVIFAGQDRQEVTRER